MILVSSCKLFTFAGTPVRMAASWLPWAILLGWALWLHIVPGMVPEITPGLYGAIAVAGVAGFFLSVVFGELIRLIAARHFGLVPESLTLHVFGGVLKLPQRKLRAKVTLLIGASKLLAHLGLGAFLVMILLVYVTTQTHLAVIGTLFFIVLANWLFLAPAGLVAALILRFLRHRRI